MRRMNRKIVILVLTASLLASAVPAATQDADSAEMLLSRARQLEEIWTKDTPAMLMEAQIQISGPKDAPIHASYTLQWVSPTQWREEIRFASYQRLRVHNGKG